MAFSIHNEHSFIRAGLLQVRKLTLEQLGIEEMSATLLQPLTDDFLVSAQIDKSHLRVHPKKIAILSFQGRAGEDGIFVRGERFLDALAQTFQPRLSIAIVQGNALFHLLNVGYRMKVIPLVKFP